MIKLRGMFRHTGKFRMAITNIITYDHPRRTSEIPTDRPRNQRPDHGRLATTEFQGRETIPSKTAQPQWERRGIPDHAFLGSVRPGTWERSTLQDGRVQHCSQERPRGERC